LHRLEDWLGRVVVLHFWSAECPWSLRATQALAEMRQAWGERVVAVAIACNANEPNEMLQRAAAEQGLPLVLHDREGQAANLYGAQTTPHLFVVDGEGLLRYQGALDDVTFRRRTPQQHYLAQAVEALLAGRRPDPAKTNPYGCAIVREV
jgi:hypothetical protein